MDDETFIVKEKERLAESGCKALKWLQSPD